MKIMREEELLQYKLQLIRGQKFHIYDNFIELDMDVKGFLDFCIAHGIETVFYKYTYYDKQDYCVTLKMLEDNITNPSELLLCADWAAAYNNATATIDFAEPCGLTLGATYGATVITVMVRNEWLDLVGAVDGLLAYKSEHEDKVLL